MRTWALLLVLPCFACAASSGVEPAAAAAAPDPDAGFEFANSRNGAFTAGWRPVGGAVPVNELFEIEVRLFEGRGRDKPLSGAQIQASAWMPEHMHGMHRQPQTQETAPGRYLVRGMLLHMEGTWQLFLDVIAGATSDRIEFALALR
jgi:hypothetical protein